MQRSRRTAPERVRLGGRAARLLAPGAPEGGDLVDDVPREARGDGVAWLVGAISIGAVVPFTVLVMGSTNRALGDGGST